MEGVPIKARTHTKRKECSYRPRDIFGKPLPKWRHDDAIWWICGKTTEGKAVVAILYAKGEKVLFAQ